MGQKRKSPSAMKITLSHLPDVVVIVEDMLGKVPKIKYVYHDITDTTKFPELCAGSILGEQGGDRTPRETYSRAHIVGYKSLQFKCDESIGHTASWVQ
jgi:hypothetical protein